MFILKKGHQPGVYVPLRALFLVDAGFQCFPLLISRIYLVFVGIYLSDAILPCLFLYRTGNC